jgi:hypothetical protein
VAAALLLPIAALAACGGSDDGGDEATATGAATGLEAPDLTDADQRVVSVLLGFVQVAGEQGDRLDACADDACRDGVEAALAQAGDEVDAALDDAGEPSECLEEAVDGIRSAADAAREGGDDALAQVRADLAEAGRAAAGC